MSQSGPTSEPSRLDRLEALAETTLLAIRELSNRQDRTQAQLDQFQASTETRLDQFEERTQARFDSFQAWNEQLQQRFDDVARQQALNAEQIAANQAGMVELRNLFADFVRSQNR